MPQPKKTDIYSQIKEVKWKNLKTAYGSAELTTPLYLMDLYSNDDEKAMTATHELWSSLCHQHAYISSASTPSYPFIKNRLKTCNDALKVELLDIIYGFAVCSSHSSDDKDYQALLDAMRKVLLEDIELYRKFIQHENEDIRYFSERIVDVLNNNQ